MKSPGEIKIFYRCTYEYVFSGFDTVNLEIGFIKYPMKRETPQGYWIRVNSKDKWISKTSRKRFAYPTKDEALNSFIARSKRRIKILNNQLDVTREGLKEAEKLGEKVQ